MCHGFNQHLCHSRMLISTTCCDMVCVCYVLVYCTTSHQQQHPPWPLMLSADCWTVSHGVYCVLPADMRSTNQALAARQAESLSNVSQELFCSPEIIRQGPMGLWRPKTSSWENVHFVLTRAGFLHWFRSMEEVAPQEEVPLNLSRCGAGVFALFG